MSYNKHTLLNKRLPSFMGVFVLLSALIITIILSRNTVLTVTKATVGTVPKNVQITNVTDTGFTVTFMTDDIAIGTLSYGTTQDGGQIALDTRDVQTGKPTEYHTHFISVTHLTPATKYYFILTSGTQIANNNGAAFTLTTAPALTNPSDANGTLNGSVALDDGTFPTEALVTVSSGESQTLTALVAADGTYSLPLTNIRSADLQQGVSLASQTVLHLSVQTLTQSSKATITAEHANAVPKIILAKNYDFTVGPDPLLEASSSGTIASQSAGFPQENTISNPVSAPEINVPRADQKFKDLQPKFEGKALPNTQIDITIHSQKEISATIQSDSNGAWEFRPPVTLDPGAHTITISSVDASGVLQKITRSFIVNAQGSQFIEPSVSPVIPTEITPQPTAVPALTPTSGPTIAPTNTPAPSFTPTPTINKSPTTVMHPTGSSTFINGVIGAVATIGIGTLLFVFTAL